MFGRQPGNHEISGVNYACQAVRFRQPLSIFTVLHVLLRKSNRTQASRASSRLKFEKQAQLMRHVQRHVQSDRRVMPGSRVVVSFQRYRASVLFSAAACHFHSQKFDGKRFQRRKKRKLPLH